MTLLEWIAIGEVGTSSRTMWSAISGAVKEGNMDFIFDVPHDSDDFRRCYLFYRNCALSDKQLKQVAKVFPWWKPFIDNWYSLCALYVEESQKGTCPKLYEIIQKLVDESRILAGWIRTSPSSWESKNIKTFELKKMSD